MELSLKLRYFIFNKTKTLIVKVETNENLSIHRNLTFAMMIVHMYDTIRFSMIKERVPFDPLIIVILIL